MEGNHNTANRPRTCENCGDGHCKRKLSCATKAANFSRLRVAVACSKQFAVKHVTEVNAAKHRELATWIVYVASYLAFICARGLISVCPSRVVIKTSFPATAGYKKSQHIWKTIDSFKQYLAYSFKVIVRIQWTYDLAGLCPFKYLSDEKN